MTNELINEPDAPRLINGLRDTGYNFRTAAADIIDNYIAAGASEINVQIEMDPEGRKYVYFGDNGSGMDAAGVFHAMRQSRFRRMRVQNRILIPCPHEHPCSCVVTKKRPFIPLV